MNIYAIHVHGDRPRTRCGHCHREVFTVSGIKNGGPTLLVYDAETGRQHRQVCEPSRAA